MTDKLSVGPLHCLVFFHKHLLKNSMVTKLGSHTTLCFAMFYRPFRNAAFEYAVLEGCARLVYVNVSQCETDMSLELILK